MWDPECVWKRQEMPWNGPRAVLWGAYGSSSPARWSPTQKEPTALLQLGTSSRTGRDGWGQLKKAVTQASHLISTKMLHVALPHGLELCYPTCSVYDCTFSAREQLINQQSSSQGLTRVSITAGAGSVLVQTCVKPGARWRLFQGRNAWVF